MELSEFREEVREDIKDLADRVSSLERSTVEYRVRFEEHAKREEATHDSVKELHKMQEMTNQHLAEYNNQLKIHIEGVNQLKTMNGKLDERLEKVETPQASIAAFFKALGYVVALMASIAGIIALFIN